MARGERLTQAALGASHDRADRSRFGPLSPGRSPSRRGFLTKRDIFSSPIVQLGIKAVGLYLVVLWLAAAVWAYRDMRNRSEMELVAYLAAALVVAFTPLFFPLAIVVYRIVRPPETLAEAWERRLSGSALEAQAEALQGCRTCGRRIDAEWLVCPGCGTRMAVPGRPYAIQEAAPPAATTPAAAPPPLAGPDARPPRRKRDLRRTARHPVWRTGNSRMSPRGAH